MGTEQASQTEDQLERIDEYDEESLVEMYRKMRQIRAFERKTSELVEQGEVPGNVHLYLGQEAVAVGTCLALRDDDIIGSTHRGHGHVLAKGADISGMMAEIAGKETGLNEGRGGSMHMVDFSLGIFGCNAIVGASVPHVAGGALSAQLDGDDRVGVAFFGDGAVNEGVVYETMNVAKIWDLPVVFLCENNQYAVSTPDEYAVAGSIPERAEAMGIPSRSVAGSDALSVHEEVAGAVAAARSGDGPQFLECRTLRYSGHFSGEASLDWLADKPYRKEDGEVERWRRERDPIATLRAALADSGTVAEARLDEIDEAVAEEIETAATDALEADFPSEEKALEDVYADQDYPTLPQGKYR
jgi:pyruvate dehydrogenase E1 component alpha subunit